MLTREFAHAGHTRRFIVDALHAEGWEVRVEHDDQVVRQMRYTDWHRLERAVGSVEREIELLQAQGWEEKAAGAGLRQSTKR